MLDESITFVGAAGLQEGDWLPLFRWDRPGHTAFYAPGCLVVAERSAADCFQTGIGPLGLAGAEPGWEATLWQHAQAAVDKAASVLHGPFQPECLTLYLNTECNLRCSYCHTAPSLRPAERLDAETVSAAAEVVAASCRNRGLPFTIVFHGGGEPTLHRDGVDELMDLLERVAADYGVAPFRYVATNGQLSGDGAAWLASRFDLVGLSCDGPAVIHDRQRARWDGSPSLSAVERTGHILREEGCTIHVRTTITARSLRRQAEIAEYICAQFSPAEIHFEPVYVGGRTGTGDSFQAHQAEDFSRHFLTARGVARDRGVSLLASGTRLGQIHGPYCHIYRHTVNLVPGGVATACFKLTTARSVVEAGAAIGKREASSGRFALDNVRVGALRRILNAERPECANCFNRYHCARECPDRCALEGTVGGAVALEPGFRCMSQKAIAAGLLNEAAKHLWAEVQRGEVKGPHGTTSF